MNRNNALVLSIATTSWTILLSIELGLSAPWLILTATVLLLVLFGKKLNFTLSQLVSVIAVLVATCLRTIDLELPEFHAKNQTLTVGQQELRPLLSGVSTDAKALVAGLTYGDDSGLSIELVDAMKTLSLTHLTAVSGANCAIVVAAVFWLTGLLGFRRTGRFLVAMLTLSAYLLLVGFEPSVVRASAMSALVLTTYVFGRKLNPLNILALAVIALLLVFPNLAFSVGFQLSALATFGIIWFAPLLFAKLKSKVPAWLALIVSVPIAAQLFCLPVLVKLQPEQSLLAIPANILVEPVVAIVTLLGVFAALISLVAPAVASALFWFASLFAQYIVAVAIWLDSWHWPGIQLEGFGSGLTLLIVAVAIAHVYNHRYRTAVLFISAILLTVLAVGQWFIAAPLRGFPVSDWAYVSCDVGQGDATIVRSKNRVALIDVGREPALIDQCLTALGVERIDLLVITHFDADHSAGLSGALEGRQIELAMLSDFPDERPGANLSELFLKQSAISTIHAHTGMQGRLGEITWKVLSPHSDGEDSEDPNDGSISMLWQSPKVNLLTLADLGERGQMRISSELANWDNASLHSNPTILKVAHHGSADQYPELAEWLRPTISTISVGRNNSYGHPTKRTLNLLKKYSKITLRTDLQGAISITVDNDGELLWQTAKSANFGG